MFPVQYSPNEPVYFLGFFTSWIRIRIQEAYLYADPCGSGSETRAKNGTGISGGLARAGRGGGMSPLIAH